MANFISKTQLYTVVFVSVLIGSLMGAAASPLASRAGLLPWLENTPFGQTANSLFGKGQEKEIFSVSQSEEESATVSAVEKVSPSVVSIVVTKDLSKLRQPTVWDPFSNDPFFKQFGFPQFEIKPQPAPKGKQEIGGGTGFVVNSEKGYVLTNKHVISDEEAEYTVVTNDGKKYPAKIAASDPSNDLAVLEIQAKLPAVTLGDSDGLKLGQTVIAIGNALGEFRNTVTKGIVSGLARNVVAGDNRGSSERLEGVIQTDAAINPGNSGGPLLNLKGEVIGINTAVSQSGQLIGFAIPVNVARQMVDSVAKYGKVMRPFLGVRYLEITQPLAEQQQLPVEYGALVSRGETKEDLAVIPGSPADIAGIRENDIILEVEGVKVGEEKSLASLLQSYQPGSIVTMKLLSQGKEKIVKVTLGEKK
ncbi:MAG: trypsin-like peptidase domain-containing protein [bacterium]